MSSRRYIFFCTVHNMDWRKPKYFLQEEPLMDNTPNTSIRCTVNNCANHCQDQNYCALNTVQIGTHETNPTEVQCVDCQSFRMK